MPDIFCPFHGHKKADALGKDIRRGIQMTYFAASATAVA